MSSEESNELKYWIPRRIYQSAPQVLFEWLFVGKKPFTEPFFEDTIASCRRSIDNNRRFKSVSDAEMMTEWSYEMSAVVPTVIIFHVSRCGSTLLSQLLSCDPRHIVLSEVPVFDEILRLPLKESIITATVANKYLHSALRFYGQKRFTNQKFLFIKSDSWHLHFYEQLRSLYPDTPFLLLFRNPLEVIRSQEKRPGIQFVPGLVEPQIFGFPNKMPPVINLPEYRALVLESLFRKMIQILYADRLAFALDYAEGMLNVLKRIYSLLDLQIEKALQDKLEERCQYHSKYPEKLFTSELVETKVPPYLQQVFDLYMKIQSLNVGENFNSVTTYTNNC